MFIFTVTSVLTAEVIHSLCNASWQRSMKEDLGTLEPRVLRDDHWQCNKPVGARDVFSLTKVPCTIHWEPLGLITENIEAAVLAWLDLLSSILHCFVKRQQLNLQCGKSSFSCSSLLSFIWREIPGNKSEISDSVWGGHHVPRWPWACSLSTIRRMEVGVDSGFQSSPYQVSMFWPGLPFSIRHSRLHWSQAELTKDFP